MEDLYVNIDFPSQKRRALLQSSRDLLSCLKVLDEFLSAKETKKELFNKISSIFDEIAVLNSKLSSKISGKTFNSEKKTPILSLTKLKVDDLSERKVESKLDVLEKELADIENKLSNLE